MSRTLAELLREWGAGYRDGGITHWDGCEDVHWACAAIRAADEIERLQSELDELTEPPIYTEANSKAFKAMMAKVRRDLRG